MHTCKRTKEFKKIYAQKKRSVLSNIYIFTSRLLVSRKNCSRNWETVKRLAKMFPVCPIAIHRLAFSLTTRKNSGMRSSGKYKTTFFICFTLWQVVFTNGQICHFEWSISPNFNNLTIEFSERSLSHFPKRTATIFLSFPSLSRTRELEKPRRYAFIRMHRQP